MQTTFKLFVPCLFLLTLFLLTGCGSKDRTAGGTAVGTAIPELTAAERAEADKLIAEHGKDVMTHFLVYAGCPEDILKHFKYFLSQGADINSTGGRDGSDWTVLHAIAGQGEDEIELVKFLITNGANVNAKDGNGMTPLDWAKESGHNPTVAEYLSGLK